MNSATISYRPRLADEELRELLAATSAVLIEGPKACGKTATARQLARSEAFLDIDHNARQAAMLTPQTLLQGDPPKLLDEWQLVPDIWNHVRRSADLTPGKGQFILTGSAAPTDDLLRHSGAGRIIRLRMRPMSLCEQGHATGEVSLGDLLAGASAEAGDAGLTVPHLAELICRGGWPDSLDETLPRAQRFVRGYIDELRRTDIERAAGIGHDPERILRLMQSLARNTATEVSLATLAKELARPGEAVQERTVGNYMEALRALFVIEELPPFSPHLRSRSRLRKSARQHFTDPSIAVGALRANPGRLLADLEYLGLLFESLVVRDLRIYASVHDAELYHYRDNTDLEVDAVIQTVAGAWLPVEAKLGSTPAIIDKAAANLLKFRDRVDLAKMGEPAGLLVVTSTGYAYCRPDGVNVVPIGALGP